MQRQKEIAGLILSAGFSSRMKDFKPLMIINGRKFIISVIEKLDLICDKILIVTGFKSEELIENVNLELKDSEILKKISFVKNENPENGMFSSLKIGVSTLENYEWILYHFVDQPQIPNEFYFDFVMELDKKYDWIQPVFEEEKGHPILFNQKVAEKIKNSEKKNLKEISINTSFKKKFFLCNYQEILKDFDEPRDLKILLLGTKTHKI